MCTASLIAITWVLQSSSTAGQGGCEQGSPLQTGIADIGGRTAARFALGVSQRHQAQANGTMTAASTNMGLVMTPAASTPWAPSARH